MNAYIRPLVVIFFALVWPLCIFSGYFSAGFPYTHDGENHLARFANYAVALKEGQFPPRIAPNLFNGYGYPVFNYNYPLANILSLPFSFLKLSYETTFSLLVFGFSAIGFLGIWQLLEALKKELSFSTTAQLFTALVYSTTPYILSSILYRGSIGEIMAYGLFPWILWTIAYASQESSPDVQKNKLFFQNFLPLLIIQTAVWTAFFLSHNVSVLFGTTLAAAYAFIMLPKTIKAWSYCIAPIIFGFGLSAWFWLPAYFEKNLIVLDFAELQSNFADHFPTLKQLFFSPLQFGFSYPGPIDSLSFMVGPFAALSLVIFGLHLLARHGHQQKSLRVAAGFSMLLLIAQLEFTAPIWKMLPLVSYIQFPWRLTLFFSAMSAPLIGYAYQSSSKVFRALLWVLLIGWALQARGLKPVDTFTKTNEAYQIFAESTSVADENLPIAFDSKELLNRGDLSNTAKKPLVLSQTNNEEISAEFTPNMWSGSERRYQLVLSQPALIIEPTMQFAGWETKANERLIPHVNSKFIGGRIAFELAEGTHQIYTQFTQNTPMRKAGNSLTVITFLMLCGLCAYRPLRTTMQRMQKKK